MAAYKVHLFLIGIGILFIVWFFNLMTQPDSFLTRNSESKDISTDQSMEEYLEELEIQNEDKMKASYDELMKRGIVFSKRKNFHDAAACYFFAKSIYPYKEEPRRFLSEAYMNLCAVHGEYCGDAKKEIYYAVRHIKESSIYYSDLLDMATALDLFPFLDMQESDVLPIFFQEKGIEIF